jgi:DNA repair protein RadD
MPLRDYQIRACVALRDARARARAASKQPRVLLVSPTGSGKTEVIVDRARAGIEQGLRVGIFAHRRELITQPAARLKRAGIPYGVVMAGRHPTPLAPVQLLSVQTVIAREDAPDLDVLIVDEAHHATAATYRSICDAYPQASIFGFTATPERADGAAMGDAFDEMIVVVTVAELQARGFLVQAEHVGPLGGKKRTNAEGMAEGELVMYARVCKAQRRGWLPGIFFCANVPHAYELAEQLCAMGVRAACIEGTTSKRERDTILERYQAGDLDVLTNVYCLTEGTDLPRTQVVGIFRGCSNWSTWVQMGGRGLRPAAGKAKCWILDPYGHTYEHGLLSDSPTFSLGGRAATLTEPLSAIRSCHACGAAFRATALVCPQCGAAIPPPPRPKVAARPQSTGAITASVGVVDHGKQWAEYCRLVYVATLNGHKLGAAGYAFERQFGHWPRYTQPRRDEALKLAEERIRADNQKAS